ncbi:group I intron-associated PD-(D/E)XK endonuclease [Phaeovulum sp.]|uniref:group I intron-associated PD-(D/E)XK endonuclease n=1 Tax=Phaeovulum sp. TaxID=2934796 RepID=UPI00272FB8C8|nr:group I intron-associated PD-(D/E)XK endonuclease [Phaeovulum sp.]MDP1669880.1 group I intron-associated PD-(D/E)XK endonuclease [Phaeovulum sp.]MDZ4118592.1 group I intron-associated PD-(D/E)XK endonuclease [Phaeovulum sp.]
MKPVSSASRSATNRYQTGQIGELLVAAELARMGYAVALPTGNAVDFDILAYKNDHKLAVQVKSSAGKFIQLNLSKFLDIEMGIDGRSQIVHGPRSNLDKDLLVAAVFLGKASGSDRIYCAKMNEFSCLLSEYHKEYLNKHGGERPGNNKASMHAACKESYFKDAPFFRIEDTPTKFRKAIT